MAVVDVVEVSPVDLGIPPDQITAITRVSSYCRVAPLYEDYSAALPYFLTIVGTRTGFLHSVSVRPPSTALSLRPRHQRSYRHNVARDVVFGKAERLNSTPAMGLTASSIAGLLGGRKSASALSDDGSETSRSTMTTNSRTPLKLLRGKARKKGVMPASVAKALGTGEAVSKVVFSPQSCRVFALSGAQVFCHYVDISQRFDFKFLGSVTAPGTPDQPLMGCLDVAVTSTPSCAAQLAVLTDSQVVFCTYDGDMAFHMNAVKASHAPGDTAFWVGSVLCVASSTDSEYRFLTTSSTKPIARLAAGSSYVAATPLYDSFDFNDVTQTRSDPTHCAVVRTADPSSLFRFAVDIVMCDPAQVTTTRTIYCLTTTPIKSLSTWGPWLMVAGSIGVEMYSILSGELVQSALDESEIQQFTLTTRAAQRSTPETDARVDALYHTRSYELAVLKPRPGSNSTGLQMATLCFHPPKDVVGELLRDADIPRALENADLAELLWRFGHSLGVKQLFSETQELANVSFALGGDDGDEYEQLRRSFRHLGCEPQTKAERCAACGTKFHFFRASMPCAACGDHFLETCLNPITSSSADDDASMVCAQCRGRCAPDLYRLIDRRLYVQAIMLLAHRHQSALSTDPSSASYEGSDDDEMETSRTAAAEDQRVVYGKTAAGLQQGYAFTLRQTGQVILQRCLDDGKFAACVLMLPVVIGSNDELWRAWVQRFKRARATAMLARLVPWRTLRRSMDQWLFTLMLMTLTNQDPEKLSSTIAEWPIDLFDADAVSMEIRTSLHRALKEARDIITTCRPNFWPEEQELDERSTVGLVYQTQRVDHLVRSLCLLFDKRGLAADAVSTFLYFWGLYSPKAVRSAAKTSLKLSNTFMDPLQRIVDDDLVVLLQPLEEHPNFDMPSFLDVVIASKGEDTAAFLCTISEIRSRPPVIQSIVRQLEQLHKRYEARMQGLTRRWGWTPTALESIDVSGILLDFLDRLSSGSKEDVKVTAPFHEMQAELYIKHKPEKLLWFLRNDSVSSVNWNRVTQFVRERKMYRELAYVVSRSGGDGTKEALRLIVRCLRSVKYAIEFVDDVNGGEELWSELMYHVRQNPALINDFLEHAGGHVNLSQFFRNIPEQNRLRLGPKQLGGVMTNANINESLTASSAASVREDNLIASGRFLKRRRAAVRFDGRSMTCHLCEEAIAPQLAAIASCGHMFHMACVENRLNTRRRHKRVAKDREESWSRRYASYELHRDDGTKDLAELLPPDFHARVLSYLPMERRRRMGLASRAWQQASIRALTYNREATDISHFLDGPRTSAAPATRLAMGPQQWTKQVECVVCRHDE